MGDDVESHMHVISALINTADSISGRSWRKSPYNNHPPTPAYQTRTVENPYTSEYYYIQGTQLSVPLLLPLHNTLYHRCGLISLTPCRPAKIPNAICNSCPSSIVVQHCGSTRFSFTASCPPPAHLLIQIVPAARASMTH